MQVTGDTITVTGLSYTQTHSVTVTAVVCPGIETNSILIPISFNTEGMLPAVSYCKARARGVSTVPLTLKMCDTRLNCRDLTRHFSLNWFEKFSVIIRDRLSHICFQCLL